MKDDHLALPKSLGDNVFAILVILFALSLSLNVFLGLRLRTSRLSFSPWPRQFKATEAITGGQPRLSYLHDLDGHPVDLSPAHNRLIYVFSPTCKWCERNLGGVQSLAKQVMPRYDLVGIVQSPEGMSNYLAHHDLPFRVVVDDNTDDMKALGFEGTPQTILVTDGKVVHNWPGAFQGDTKNSIERALGVSIASESH